MCGTWNMLEFRPFSQLNVEAERFMSLTVRNSRFRRWAGNVLAVGAGFLAVAALLASAEGALRLKSRLTAGHKPPPFALLEEGAVNRGGILGWELKPNGVIRCRAQRGEQVVYDVTCETDAAGRRFTPCDCLTRDAKVAAFFGCSMTFGQGVKDDETLPARFCAHVSGWQSFNYGVFGYGPQQMWLQICKREVLKEFAGRRGAVIYPLIDHHIERLIGTPSVLATWARPLPWLEMKEDQVVYRGTFQDRSPLQYFFFRHVYGTHLVRFVESRLPQRQAASGTAGSTLDLLAGVIIECSQATARQAPGLAFYCVLLPKNAGPWEEGLLKRLNGTGVRVLNYEALLDGVPTPVEDLFFLDAPAGGPGHFKPVSYDLMAQRLSRDIAANEK